MERIQQRRRRHEARLPNEDFAPLSRQDVWDAAEKMAALLKLGLVPGPDFGQGEGPPEAPEKPEGVGILPAPEVDVPPAPETTEASDVAGDKGELRPAQQGETPTPTATETQVPTPFPYKVQEGDTLDGLAQIYGVTVQDLMILNSIENVDHIEIDQILLIGKAPQVPTATPTATAAAKVEPTPTATQAAKATQEEQEKAQELLDSWYEEALSDYAGDQRATALAERSYYQATQLIESGGYSLRDVMGIYVEWTPPPMDETGNYQYAVVNQFVSEIIGNTSYGPNACGLVGASSGAMDLGYPTSILDGISKIFDAAGADYGPYSGIQPSKLYAAVHKAITSGDLGAIGEVYEVQAIDGLSGLIMINEALEEGNVVIVDVLVVSKPGWVGTYLIGVSGPVGFPDGADKTDYVAHFPRVLGFEDDGETIVLAETFNPEEAGDVIKVPVDDFLAAWLDPERRAFMENDEVPGNDIELVNNWMLVITPPSKDE